MIEILFLFPLLLTTVTSNVDATSESRVRINNHVRVEVNGEVQETREQIRLEYQERVQDAKEMREQTREEFRLKLTEIKNERKRNVVEKLDTRLNEVNSSWVEKWNDALERLMKILDKLEERSGETYGDARAAIAAAQESVNAQAGVVYTIEIDTEDNLGEVTSSSVAELRADMKLVWESVKTAREAVVAALVSYRGGLEGESE